MSQSEIADLESEFEQFCAAFAQNSHLTLGEVKTQIKKYLNGDSSIELEPEIKDPREDESNIDVREQVTKYFLAGLKDSRIAQRVNLYTPQVYLIIRELEDQGYKRGSNAVEYLKHFYEDDFYSRDELLEKTGFTNRQYNENIALVKQQGGVSGRTFLHKVLVAYRELKTVPEIARLLRVDRSKVEGAVRRLRRMGEIPSGGCGEVGRPKGVRNRTPVWGDLKHARTREFIKLKQQGCTFQEIADHFGFSRQNAEQIKRRIIRKLGVDIFRVQPNFERFTQRSIRFHFGIKSSNHFGEILRLSSIKTEEAYYSRRQVKRLYKAFDTWRRLKCCICDREFIPKRRTGKIPLCSRKCRDKRRHNTQHSNFSGTREFTGWTKGVHEALKDHVLPEDDIILTRVEAFRFAGCSQMQITYLRNMNIVSLLSHPTRLWRGKPAAGYSKAEMLIVRDVYQKHFPPNAEV